MHNSYLRTEQILVKGQDMMMKDLLNLSGDEREKFYQAKYDQYKVLNLGALIASCATFIILYFADVVLCQTFEWQTLLMRCAVLIPLSFVILIYQKTNNYKVMSILSFGIIYSILGCNFWISVYLGNEIHLNESFMVIFFMLLLVSFSSPPLHAALLQWGSVLVIIFAINIYDNTSYHILVVYLCQICILLCLVDYIIAISYFHKYKTEKKLEWIVYHDSLTQVYNRNKLNELMEKGGRLRSFDNSASILLIDIDYFKKVNDTYGHDKGDIMLKYVADKIKSRLRKNDVVIRWGGEEFVVIMSDCGINGAYEIAERIREEIAVGSNGICNISISIGIVDYDGGDCMEAIKKADHALYQAKERGRNRVVQYI